MAITSSSVFRAIRALTLCSLYMVCGPALIVINKSIMTKHGFPYPLALSALGLVSSAAVARFVVTMGWGEIRDSSRQAVEGSAFWSKLAPVGASYACALGFGNSAYLFLDVGFVQMMKVSLETTMHISVHTPEHYGLLLLTIFPYIFSFLSTIQAFTPVTLLVVLWAFNVEIPTLRVVQSVCVIAFGTILSTASAPSLSIPGLLFVFGAEIGEALRLVLTQSLLVNNDFSVLEGQYFLAPVASVALLTLAATIEIPKAQALSNNDRDSHGLAKFTGREMNQNGYLSPLDAIAQSPELFLAASIVGVLVNYLGYFVIREVGSLTLKILGTFRNLGLIAYGLLFLREFLAPMQCIGYAVSLVAFFAYTYFKSLSMTQDSIPAQRTDPETKQTIGDGLELESEASHERSLSWESDASDLESAVDIRKKNSPHSNHFENTQLSTVASDSNGKLASETQRNHSQTQRVQGDADVERIPKPETDEFFEVGSI